MHNFLLLPKRLHAMILLAAWSLTMTPKDVFATIATSKTSFVPIYGKPMNNNLIRLSKCLTPILLGIP